MPINKYVNTFKQTSDIPINKNVKEIINNNKIDYKNRIQYKSDRDYSNFDFESLYAINLFIEKT